MMQKILIVSLLTVFLCLGLSVYRNVEVQKDYETAVANVKAYDSQLSESYRESRVLSLTVDQLQYYKDSLLNKMDSVRKVLKIKDKNIKTLQYVSSIAEKADTIVLRDTVLQKPDNNDSMVLDTTIGDAWYKMTIKLKYPNKIITKPQFKSQKYITVCTKKETINPPKKWWLLRIFQKKHEVVIVNVLEENPYIQDSICRFVEIVK